jgi:class 3 adenylate cyclase/tetratricopeptide (TPR) repeat protein
VTVLFADVKGSTELIRDLDPEDAQQLLDGATQVMMDAVHRFEGTVSRSMGDGVMALFGAPIAHEDHAVRACYAALVLQDGMRRYADEARRRYGIGIEARVGLNSGEVIVRLISDDLHMDYTAMGQTVHLASRMEQLAAGGSIRLTAETLALVEGYVEVRSLGPVPVKGLSEPVEIFDLLGGGRARTRLQAAASRGLTRFVGRQAELEALYTALARAGAGQGQVAALVGEPGVGKSRLVWELTHSHRTQGWTILESGSVSYGKATSWLPVIDLLKSYCRVESRDDARAIREKVTGKLLALDRALEPTLPALLALLDALPPAEPGNTDAIGLPLSRARDSTRGARGEGLAWEDLDPAQRRRRTLDAVRRLFLRESQEQPLLLVFEDLHWIDAETQALLDSLIESLPAARALLLVNFRPEYRHEWGGRGYYTQLRIDPLGEESADDLLAGLLGHDLSVEPLKALLIRRTQGNPLFLEESVRALIETGSLAGEPGAYRLPVPLAAIQVPATVQAVLAARIDSLPTDQKQLLQTAAVIGKDVPDALLRAIADRADDDLERGLAALQAAEFVYEATLFPEREYTFKHALTHEVTYGSLLHDRRKALHARVVQAIEHLHADRLDEQTERLAHHALRAEAWEQAVTYARQASARAADRSAFREATTWLTEALRGLGHLPDSRATQEAAIDIRVELRKVLSPLGEFHSVLTYLDEARILAETLGDRQRLAAVYSNLSSYMQQMGDLERAIEYGERALALARSIDSLALEFPVTFELGVTYYTRGAYRQAVDCFEWAAEHFAGDSLRERFDMHSLAAVVAQGWLGYAQSALGEFDEAIPHGTEALKVGEIAGHAYSLTGSYNCLGLTYIEQGAFQRTSDLLERGIALAEEADLPFRVRLMSGHLGYAYAQVGRITEGIALLEWAMERFAEMGHLAYQSLRAGWLSEAYLLAGRPDDAGRLAEQAVEFGITHSEAGHQARALRMVAECAVHREPPDVERAGARYREALVLAEELGMRPLQAHCHLGLGKLYRRSGRLDEARAELSTAVAMLREMGMAFWLPEAERELAQANTSDQ